jgi:hypothetical protein
LNAYALNDNACLTPRGVTDILEFIIVKNRYYFIVAMRICINNFLDKIHKIASIIINNLGDMKACKLLPTLFRIPRKSYI